MVQFPTKVRHSFSLIRFFQIFPNFEPFSRKRHLHYHPTSHTYVRGEKEVQVQCTCEPIPDKVVSTKPVPSVFVCVTLVSPIHRSSCPLNSFSFLFAKKTQNREGNCHPPPLSSFHYQWSPFWDHILLEYSKIGESYLLVRDYTVEMCHFCAHFVYPDHRWTGWGAAFKLVFFL